VVAAAVLVASIGPGAAQAAKKKQKTPPPPYFAVNLGEKLLYLVPGHVNDNTSADTVGTLVTCINVGFPAPVDVRVEVWSNPGNAPLDQLTVPIPPGTSVSWETQPMFSFTGVVLPGNIFVSNGSLRIVQIGSGKVICRAAQVMKPEAPDSAATSVRELPVIPVGGEASVGGKKKK
jgi:hypothetical protein